MHFTNTYKNELSQISASNLLKTCDIYNRWNCTKYETCANLHRFRISFIFSDISNSTNHQLPDMLCKQISLKAVFNRQGSLNRSLAKLIAIFAGWVSIENIN